MSRPRNPNITTKVEKALDLIRAEGASKADAARTVGLSYATLKYRLNERERVAAETPTATVVTDGLRETPTDEGEVPVFVRDYTHLSALRVYPIGDLHMGATNFAEGALDEWLAYLLESAPGVSMLNTGDNTNCAIKGSVSDTHGEQLTVGQARSLQTEKFRPLADAGLIDAIVDGNHELRVYRATGDSPNAAVAEALGLNYSPAACIVRYQVGDQSYDCYLRHGTGGGSTMGAAVNRLAKQETIIDADLYVSGHTHTQVAFPKNVFVPNGRGGFRRKKRLFCASGSFLSYEDYAAQAGLPPAHIGAPRVFLDGTRHDLHASV